MADPTVQIWDGSWYKLGNMPLHECCGCGLVHKVDYKLERGVIFERWRIDEKETRKARRKKAK